MPEVGPAICGRISFITSYEYFWNPFDNKAQHDYHSEVDYALNGKQGFANGNCGKSGGSEPGGETSVALTYDNGTDKDTGTIRDQLKLLLTYQY